MTIRHSTRLATLLAAALTIASSSANAQQTARIAIRSAVTVSVNSDQVVLTTLSDDSAELTDSCWIDAGFDGDEQQRTCIVVNADVWPHATRIDGMYVNVPLPAGTRLKNLALVYSCTELATTFRIYEGTIATPQNSTMALAVTPAGVSLSEGHEAVVGAGTAESSIAAAVCVKQGSQSIKTPIISDIPLEPGDRLTDFVEVDFDPATGETMYACRVEY